MHFLHNFSIPHRVWLPLGNYNERRFKMRIPYAQVVKPGSSLNPSHPFHREKENNEKNIRLRGWVGELKI